MLEKIKKICLFVTLFIIYLFSDIFYLFPLHILNIDYNTLSYNQKISLSLFSSLIICVIIFLIYRKYLKEKIIDFKNNYREYFDIGIKYWFIGLIGMMFFNILIPLISPVDQANNEAMIQEMLKLSPILSFISATFFAPFIEEMIFRKSLGDIFKNKKIMVFMSALIFGLLHVVFSLKTPWDLLYILPYGSLGAAFAYIIYKKDNIFIPIFFHVLHNGVITFFSIIQYIVMVF